MPCQCDQRGEICSCTFVNGLQVTIDGGGTDADPVSISVAPMYLEGEDTATATTAVTGTGDVPNPYLLKVEAIGLTGMVGKWVGTEAEYAAAPPAADALAVIVSPAPRIAGVENLYVGGERLVRAYLGSVMVADDDGGVLGPGI
jgi:hypothetical protein